MITKNSLLSGFFLGLGWVCVSGNLVVAQLPISERCLAEAESCTYQKYPQYNQQLDFRTSPQIEQRRQNTIEKINAVALIPLVVIICVRSCKNYRKLPPGSNCANNKLESSKPVKIGEIWPSPPTPHINKSHN